MPAKTWSSYLCDREQHLQECFQKHKRGRKGPIEEVSEIGNEEDEVEILEDFSESRRDLTEDQEEVRLDRELEEEVIQDNLMVGHRDTLGPEQEYEAPMDSEHMKEREAFERAMGLGPPDIGTTYPDSMILGPPTEMAGTLFSRKDKLAEQAKDINLMQVKQWILDNGPPPRRESNFQNANLQFYRKIFPDLVLWPTTELLPENQLVSRIDPARPSNRPRFCVPAHNINLVLRSTHLALSHLGAEKMCWYLKDYVTFPSMWSVCRDFILTCGRCVQKHRYHLNKRMSGAFYPRTRSHISCHIDLAGPLPSSGVEGYKYILGIVDGFSGYLVTIPL